VPFVDADNVRALEGCTLVRTWRAPFLTRADHRAQNEAARLGATYAAVVSMQPAAFTCPERTTADAGSPAPAAGVTPSAN
jgi:hypothetical protein